jgi:predicted oxidoreductase (fatty acid repression mutant protein)
MYPTKLATAKTVESKTDETEGTVSELVEDNSAEVWNKFQTSLYLASVNMSKHGKVINELQHQYINKQDNYPSTPEDAMTMLSHSQDTTHKKKFHKEKEKPTEDEMGIANFA